MPGENKDISRCACLKKIPRASYGKNSFAEISKNLARSENNFVGPSK